MRYEQSIVCEFCGVRASAVEPAVPRDWVTMTPPQIIRTQRAFCGLDCMTKFVNKKLEEQEAQSIS